MKLETVLFEVTDHVATITLNRPQAMNGFNQLMLEEFSAIWETEMTRFLDAVTVDLTPMGT